MASMERERYTLEVRPVVDGRARVEVRLENTSHAGSYDIIDPATGLPVPWKPESVWTGAVRIDLPVVIRSGSAADLFSDRERVLSGAGSDLEKIRAVEFDVGEASSTATTFLLKQLNQVDKDSPVRIFLVRSLVEMAARGYGYEAIPKLVDVMSDETEAESVRLLAIELLRTVYGREYVMVTAANTVAYAPIKAEDVTRINAAVDALKSSKIDRISRKTKEIVDRPVQKPSPDPKPPGESGNVKPEGE